MERSDVNGSSDVLDCPKNLLAIEARKKADEEKARLADQHLRQKEEFRKIELELSKNLDAKHELELALINEGTSVPILHYVEELVKLKEKQKELEDKLEDELKRVTYRMQFS